MPDLPPCRLDRRCPKCGSDDIRTRWVKAAPFFGSAITIPKVQRRKLMNGRLAEEEHLARHCDVCQYRWAEKPLDQCSAIDQLGAVADA